MTVGHEPYWAQFPRLKEELGGYGCEFEEMLRKHDVEVISAGFDYRNTTTYMQLANDNICSLPEIQLKAFSKFSVRL